MRGVRRAIAPLNFAGFSTRSTPPCHPGFDIHLVLDNLSTHKAPTVNRWLAQHPRHQRHFMPTSGSWRDQVETWNSVLTRRRGVHRRVDELGAALLSYIERINATAKPFRWTKSADEILQA